MLHEIRQHMIQAAVARTLCCAHKRVDLRPSVLALSHSGAAGQQRLARRPEDPLQDARSEVSSEPAGSLEGQLTLGFLEVEGQQRLFSIVEPCGLHALLEERRAV